MSERVRQRREGGEEVAEKRSCVLFHAKTNKQSDKAYHEGSGTNTHLLSHTTPVVALVAGSTDCLRNRSLL